MNLRFAILIFFIFTTNPIFAQKVGNGGNFSTQQMRAILAKFSEAIEYSISPQAAAFAELSQNTQEIYSLDAKKYANLQKRILVLPSTRKLNGKKTICLIALDSTLQEIVSHESLDMILENTVFFPPAEAEENENILKTIQPALDQRILPTHCQMGQR